MVEDAADPARWPDSDGLNSSGVAVVTVNHNTAELIALLLWSLYRVLKTDHIDEVVVIDNGSADGSVELLAGLAEAGLCQHLANEDNRQHGPGLNQGLSHLAARARATGRAPAWVWILDSDCVIAGSDALDEALQRGKDTGASVIGEAQADPWHGVDRFGTHCLLIDPAQTWREPIAAFDAGGDPSFEWPSTPRPWRASRRRRTRRSVGLNPNGTRIRSRRLERLVDASATASQMVPGTQM